MTTEKPKGPVVGKPESEASSLDQRPQRTRRRPRVRGRSDAHAGKKTAKNGREEVYYGYEMHALVRVASGRAGDFPNEPQVIEMLRLTPANRDIVDPSLEMIDRILDAGQRINYLLVDRHYHYKRYRRWLLPLVERGIKHVHDLREDEIGFKEWNGTLMAAGVPHCPKTPIRLGDIAPLGPPPPDDATEERWMEYLSKKAAFERDIAERESYAAKRHSPLDAQGRSRWICPAVGGKCGCALRQGTVTVATELGLPIVASPPTPADAPAMCRQKVFTLQVTTPKQEQVMKLYQDQYWGSPKHRANYSRRTYVEGFFGILKSGNSAGKDRDGSMYTGLAHESVDATMFSVASNIRLLRSWHADTGLGDNESPLLFKERTDTIAANLTIEEHQRLAGIRSIAEDAA